MREFNRKLDVLVDSYLAVSSLRPKVLFENFLPTGYEHTTLSSVPAESRSSLILAKVRLGMIITLYDDLADRPDQLNPDLLEHLYRLNIDRDHNHLGFLSADGTKLLELSRFLFKELTKALKELPHFSRLVDVLRFDLEQFYNCNRHSTLVTRFPEISNPTESRLLGPYNMGIMAAGTMDLMASPGTLFSELGPCREAFFDGQRMGRISNVLVTYHREAQEGDHTNEIHINRHLESAASYRLKLQNEFVALHDSIKHMTIKTFDTEKYADGLLDLHHLHSSLEGQI